MSNAPTKGNALPKRPVRLLKRIKVVTAPDGTQKVFNNLYLQLGDGMPIAIELPTKLYNHKVKNLLLANADEYTPQISIKNGDSENEKDF